MTRDRSVIFRLTHEEYSAMEAAAGARGVSRSELIRGAVLREIGRGPGAELDELRTRVEFTERRLVEMEQREFDRSYPRASDHISAIGKMMAAQRRRA